MSVFNELMTVWPEFQNFRSSVGEEQLLSVLEQKRAGHRARVRRQRRKEEEEEEERRTQVRKRRVPCRNLVYFLKQMSV